MSITFKYLADKFAKSKAKVVKEAESPSMKKRVKTLSKIEDIEYERQMRKAGYL